MATTTIRQIESALETAVRLVDEEHDIYRTWDDVFLTVYEIGSVAYVEFVDFDYATPLEKASEIYELVCQKVEAERRYL